MTELKLMALGSTRRPCMSSSNMESLDGTQGPRVEPNVISFSSVINVCEKGRQWQQALVLLDDMQGRRMEPNVINFSALPALRDC